MTTAHRTDAITPPVRLHLALELGWTEWKLAFTIGHGQPPRLRTIRARDTQALLSEIAKAKRRFRLLDDAPVVSCYEAGRYGFWLHRWLAANGIQNVVIDSASIEVNRRKRRAKTDRLDAAKLVARGTCTASCSNSRMNASSTSTASRACWRARDWP
jgi:transposase